jgi:4-hydroxyproline epimerase
MQRIATRSAMEISKIEVVDSHTGGEPTRVVIDGGPELGSGPLEARLARMRSEFDHYRRAVVCEPRGSDVLVGALLVPPQDPACTAGVIFFNNVGYLGMCGHGTIGLVATLAYLGRMRPGTHAIETPVGKVTVRLRADGEVEVDNVPSWRAARAVSVEVPGAGVVTGDIAWGGNWFFLAKDHGQRLDLARVDELTEFSWKVRQAVNAQGHPEVDHVELFGPAQGAEAHSRNFVLCPGKAYDRSPCGTGTSAKVSCLAAEGQLREGEEWVQESILGSQFRARYRWADAERRKVLPTIIGRASVNGHASLLLDPRDEFCWGIR